MKRKELAIAAIKIATSIEAHLTGAVATISQRNQGISEGVGISFFDFSFLNFKAKAFSFCHFFLPAAKEIPDQVRDDSGQCHPERSEGSSKFLEINK